MSNINDKWTLDRLLRPDIMVSVALATFPAAFGLYSGWKIQQRFRGKQFSNIINISLNSVQKCNNQYSLYWRTIIENDIHKTMINPTGVRQLQKAAKKTSPSFPLIKPNNIDHESYKTNCNIISNQINMLCTPYWIQRLGYNDNPKTIASDMFIYALAGSQGQPKEILTLKKIFVILLKERTMEGIIDDIGTNIHTMTGEEWKKKLKDNEIAHYHVLHRWTLIREILKEYDLQKKDKYDGFIEWGEPLCDIELSFPYIEELAEIENIEPINPAERQPFNAWHRHDEGHTVKRDGIKKLLNLL